MAKKTDRDEIQDAIELLTRRLDRIRLDIQRQEEGCDPRLLGLFKGEVSEVIADLERYRAETAAAIANANTGYAVSRAYLAVGKLAASTESAKILSFDKNRNKSHARRSNH
ncbi:hypothetical protein KL86PLE_130179 [uncultured Pleomorphomonas sp.]|uniref:Uncharacterized protein n=2 Tax=Pleomorphomonas TaxID=261933 RepID=A0A2G9WV12_9HYPH|nr:hypothetical protein [Pleomorphomonas carboxyditropha]PIO98152.1 hypothetical protein CJ014_15945 [Pleomorphomonas carboxyditropha]SCM74336.1 hypothetical protein KL86PLE_130179 [uncultured Pleomorphomonas sp.]